MEASWARTHDGKHADFYTEKGSIRAGRRDDLSVRNENGPPKPVKPGSREYQNEWEYPRKIVRGVREVDPFSSLELNKIVA